MIEWEKKDTWIERMKKVMWERKKCRHHHHHHQPSSSYHTIHHNTWSLWIVTTTATTTHCEHYYLVFFFLLFLPMFNSVYHHQQRCKEKKKKRSSKFLIQIFGGRHTHTHRTLWELVHVGRRLRRRISIDLFCVYVSCNMDELYSFVFGFWLILDLVLFDFIIIDLILIFFSKFELNVFVCAFVFHINQWVCLFFLFLFSLSLQI